MQYAFLLDCHQLLSRHLWCSGIKHSLWGLSRATLTGWRNGLRRTSKRDIPPFILKMWIVTAIKMYTCISAMQYQTGGFILKVLLLEHFTWGMQRFFIYTFPTKRLSLFTHHKIVMFLHYEKSLSFSSGLCVCMCLRVLTGNEEMDCLSRRYMKVSRFQVLNIHGVGQQATVLEPQAHTGRLLY